MASEQKNCTSPFLSWHRKNFFPPFHWYGGEMLAILEDSSVTNKTLRKEPIHIQIPVGFVM
jgi:hypothetical protein